MTAGRPRLAALSPPLLLGCTALLLLPLGPDPSLRYERAAVTAGESWRLLTGHLLHLHPMHLLLNLAGLALIWALVGRHLRPRAWAAALPLLALGTGAGLLLHPSIGWYVGLSGILHGVLVLGAVCGARQAPLEGTLLLGAVTAKLVWEGFMGPASEAVGPVIIEAHRYGALAGLLIAPLFIPRAPAPEGRP